MFGPYWVIFQGHGKGYKGRPTGTMLGGGEVRKTGKNKSRINNK
jgi:hypothetical protein